jgi:hypothetical protein
MNFHRMRELAAGLVPWIYGIILFSVLIVPVAVFLTIISVRVARAAAAEDVVNGEILTSENGTSRILVNKGLANESIVEIPLRSLITDDGNLVETEVSKPGSHLKLRLNRGDFDSELNKIFYQRIGISCIVSLAGLLVPSWLPLFPFERNRKFYERLGINQFRRYANNGAMIRSLIAYFDPKALTHFNLSTLETHKQFYDFGERMHWNWFCGTIPAFIWAIALEEYGWVLVFSVTNLIINIYPIMLERYMRVRVVTIEQRRASAVARRIGGS